MNIGCLSLYYFCFTSGRDGVPSVRRPHSWRSLVQGSSLFLYGRVPTFSVDVHMKQIFQGPAPERSWFMSSRMGPRNLHLAGIPSDLEAGGPQGMLTETLTEVRGVDGKVISTAEGYLCFWFWIECRKGLPLGSPKYFSGRTFYLRQCLN